MVTPADNAPLELDEAPIIRDPSTKRATTDELVPLLHELQTSKAPVTETILRRGTLRPDGALDLCKQGLGADGATLVLDALSASPFVKHILLGTNGLGYDGTEAVATAIRREHHLETLYLGCNQIDGDAVAPLASVLEHDATVRSLWLKRNALGDEGAKHIAQMLASNTSLTTLDLVCTSLTLAGVEAISDALRSNPRSRVQRLYLGGNQLDQQVCSIVAQLAADVPQINYISLSANPVGDEGAVVVADRLARLERGVSVGLSDCGLTKESASAAAALVGFAPAVNFAARNDWSGSGARKNQLGDSGAAAIADRIRSGNAAVQVIGLSGNGLTSRGAQALADALETAPHKVHTITVGSGTARSLRARIRAASKPRPDAGDSDLAAIRSRYR